MHVILDLSTVTTVAISEIQALINERIGELHDNGFELSEVGYFLIAEPADTAESIEAHLGLSLSSYELIQEYMSCFDLVYVLDQSGMGVEIIIPKDVSTNADLLVTCNTLATEFRCRGTP